MTELQKLYSRYVELCRSTGTDIKPLSGFERVNNYHGNLIRLDLEARIAEMEEAPNEEELEEAVIQYYTHYALRVRHSFKIPRIEPKPFEYFEDMEPQEALEEMGKELAELGPAFGSREFVMKYHARYIELMLELNLGEDLTLLEVFDKYGQDDLDYFGASSFLNKEVPRLEALEALGQGLEDLGLDMEDCFEISELLRSGGGEYQRGHREFLFLSDREANEKATEYIRETLFAFHTSHLASVTDLPECIFESLAEKCEDANDTIYELIEKCGNGFEEFAEDAIQADGRGHFIAHYDHEEHELTYLNRTWFVYRTN